MSDRAQWALSWALAFLAVIFIFLGLPGCASSARDLDPPASICAIDFKNQMCWVEKQKNIGYSFSELDAQNQRCDKGPPDLCWFAIGHSDLIRLLQARKTAQECEE